MTNKKILLIGSIVLFLAVLLGAFGAHGLKKILEPQALETFKTGVTYQFYHGFGLICLALVSQIFNIEVKKSALLFIVGIFLFSGNCYLYSITQIKTIAMIIPAGGLSFISGWLLLTINISKKRV
jgi:uncharacterized membrane protein YgdD (TMEM256/DUF423 family)